MTRFLKLTAIAIILSIALAAAAFAVETAKLTVQVDKPSHKISPTLYGIFYEEINCSGDGGIYPEMVRNRSFEDSDKPDYWKVWPEDTTNAAISLSYENPTKRKFNTKSLKVELTGTGPKGVTNEGWWGMGVTKGEKYNLSFYAKSDTSRGITISVRGAQSVIASADFITTAAPGWQHFNTTITSSATDPKASLVISSEKPGTLWLDFVSLMPAKTWKNHGLRPDLAEMINGMKPEFVRFPGGCWVEGNTMAEAQRWKTTIGPVEDRRTQHNIWGYEATNGLGYHEYLQLSEDLGSEPLFVINCGMSHRDNVPMDKMDEFVQDALDAIEYANGPADSKWGSVRAKAGHPKPFNMKYMEIGNENGYAAYNERWPLFVKAIKAKYPEMNLIANVWGGGYPKEPAPEIIDEHYYSTPEFFINNANKYDTYDRKGPKIYVGEYAVTQGTGKGSMRGAVGEAAFMVGMERNSDIVTMSSYAPLLVNVNRWAWPVNLIVFDTDKVFGIPSYYVQQMFSQNKGDVVLPVQVSKSTVYSEPTHGAIGVGTWLTSSEFKDIVVTKGNETLYKSDFTTEAKDWKMINGEWKVADGALQETAITENARATFGDQSWKEYTLTCKARKISGEEGFLIVFYAQDQICGWWNIGGWGNTQHAIEWNKSTLGKRVNGSIETGKWYDIKVELTKERIKCYLDGKLIHDETYPMLNPLHSTASRDDKTGDVIVKVVNASWQVQPTEIELAGAKNLGKKAEVTVLTAKNGMDENSMEAETIKPKTSTIEVKGTQFKYDFPANSVTVMRFKTAK